MKPVICLMLFLIGLTVGMITSVHARASHASDVLITAVYFDPSVTGEASEAVEVRNIGAGDAAIGGRGVGDGEGTVSFPTGLDRNLSGAGCS